MPDGVQPMNVAALKKIEARDLGINKRMSCKRHPQLRRAGEAMHAGRHYSDDGEGRAAEVQRAPEHVGCGAEAALPERLAQNNERASVVFFSTEDAAFKNAEPEQRKV